MKTGKYLLLSAVVAIAITACSSEEVPNEQAKEIQLSMIYPGQASRATDIAFEASDLIGVYVTGDDAALQLGGNEVNNEQFKYNGSTWTSTRNVYWNSGKHNVYAYYPYSELINDVENYSFKVQEDQSSPSAYTQSDFMWASVKNVSASANPVPMQFSHKMSNVIVSLQKGENFKGDIPTTAEVYLYSTITEAVIDLSTGDVAQNSYVGEATIKCRKINDSTFTAIVVPQSITSRRPLVEVVIDNVSYLMEGKISFRQGYRHTIVVTLDEDPDQIKINVGGQIEGW